MEQLLLKEGAWLGLEITQMINERQPPAGSPRPKYVLVGQAAGDGRLPGEAQLKGIPAGLGGGVRLTLNGTEALEGPPPAGARPHVLACALGLI